jgi:hypothetical protein
LYDFHSAASFGFAFPFVFPVLGKIFNLIDLIRQSLIAKIHSIDKIMAPSPQRGPIMERDSHYHKKDRLHAKAREESSRKS